jgi:hypothetical protein
MSETQQELWDLNIEMCREASWRNAHMIASKMSRCANNPRNGGDGHGTCPYSVDDADEKRYRADSDEGGMRRRWR